MIYCAAPSPGYSARVNRFGALLFLLLAWLAAGTASAQTESGGRHMQVTLAAESRTVAPGAAVALAFEMRPDPGWHGYWRNPGDAGAEPRVTWQLPEGWSAGPLQYPVPDRLTLIGLMNYVYERDHALLTELRAPAGIAVGTRVPVRAQLDYLVCTDTVCVPERSVVATELAVGSGGERAADFSSFRQKLPRPLAAPGRFEVAGERLRIAIPLPPSMGLDSPYFYPVTLDSIDHSAFQSVSRNGDFLIVETRAGAKARSLSTIEGVLEIGPGLGLSLVANPGSVPAAGTPVATASPAAEADLSTLMVALLGALAGGLLLNIMPCVFPILSLKALSLARAGESDGSARREALAYGGGVVLTCLALGGLLLLLRAAGETAGWPRLGEISPPPSDPALTVQACAAMPPRHPELPAAVGHAVALRGSARRRAGGLDTASFGSWYAALTDLSLRLSGLGWRNVLCETAFVARGGEGGPDEGDLDALAARWPAWHSRLAGFLMHDPLHDAREHLQVLHAQLRHSPQHDLFAAPVAAEPAP